MKQKHLLHLFMGTYTLIKQTSKLCKEKAHSYIEDHIIKGNYVSREEFEQLKNSIFKNKNRPDKN